MTESDNAFGCALERCPEEDGCTSHGECIGAKSAVRILSPPGSPHAKENGCLCPQVDNAHGKGMGGLGLTRGEYVVRADCPIHGDERNRS